MHSLIIPIMTCNCNGTCNQDAVSRMRDRLQEIETISIEDVEGLGQLKVGKALAKGSNAVIYEAERKEVGK